MNHPTPTPKPFNGFKYIVIPLLILLSASVFAFGIFTGDEGKRNLPWQSSVSAIPTLASTDTYGCPYAQEKANEAQLEHTSLVATPRQETYLSFDISAANEGKHYDITLLVPADEPAFTVGGEVKAARHLIAGDKVYLTGDITGIVKEVKQDSYSPTSYTPDAKGRVLARVMGKTERWTGELLYLYTKDEVIQTTPEHPFMVNGAWTEAKDIRANDQIETREGGFVTIAKTELVHEPQMVYNLHVEGAHTFFVGEGQLLTHNNDCFPALRNFSRQDFMAGGNNQFSITTERMRHFLERHHPNFWYGSVKTTQTFFNQSLSIDDIADLAKKTVQQGFDARVGSNGRFRYTATIDGTTYIAATEYGKVVQFFPLPPQ